MKKKTLRKGPTVKRQDLDDVDKILLTQSLKKELE
jgi:hypothetical protein